MSNFVLFLEEVESSWRELGKLEVCEEKLKDSLS